jgi:hypothetical protein
MSKEVICNVCNAPVSKRKSLAFTNDKGMQGRACRTHQEVIDHVADQIKEVDMEKLDDKMSLIMAVSMVRVMHTVKGIPVSVLLWKIREKKGKEFYRKCVDEIDRLGAKIPVGELMTGMLSYGNLFIKKTIGR